jgi:hypothetical protein
LYHIFGPVCLQVTSNGVGVTLQCSNTFVCCHHVINLQSVLVEFSLQSHRYVIDSSLQVMVYRHIYVSICL